MLNTFKWWLKTLSQVHTDTLTPDKGLQAIYYFILRGHRVGNCCCTHSCLTFFSITRNSPTSPLLFGGFRIFFLSFLFSLSFQVSHHAPWYPSHPPLNAAGASRSVDWFYYCFAFSFSWEAPSVALWYSERLDQGQFSVLFWNVFNVPTSLPTVT